MRRHSVVTLFLALLLIACGVSCAPDVVMTARPAVVTFTPAQIPAAMAAPTATLTVLPTATATPPEAPREAITVMTYNVLGGAGVDTVLPGVREWAEGCGYPGNRLPGVLEVIRAVAPDILGIQEANQWDAGDPPIAQEVAAQLGMDYFVGRSTNPESGFAHVVLFSKFPIREAEDYSGHFSAGALRAELGLPGGESIHVFVVHLDRRPGMRNTELSFLLDRMQPHINDLTVLMGDLNFFDHQQEATILREAGWRHPLGSWQAIDQIWTSPGLEPYVELGPVIRSELTDGISDHLPEVVVIGIPGAPGGSGR